MTLTTADILRAAAYAAQKHSAQRRKGAGQEPYVNHVLEVADRLARATQGNDLVLILGGLLHDTVEDCGVTPDELTERFGADVSALVLEVTDDKSLEKAERKRHQIVNAPHKSDRAKMLKLADKSSNLNAILTSPPANWPKERKQEYFAWAKAVIAGCRGVNPALEAEFDRLYQQGVASLIEN